MTRPCAAPACCSADGRTLWYSGASRDAAYRGYGAIFRARRAGWDAERRAWRWDAPEEVVTRYAGEPTLDGDGNLIFTHHYFFVDPEHPDDPERPRPVESDIFVARKRR